MEQCLAEGLMLTGSDDCFECLAFRVSNKTREVEYMADSYELAFWRQQGRLTEQGIAERSKSHGRREIETRKRVLAL